MTKLPIFFPTLENLCIFRLRDPAPGIPSGKYVKHGQVLLDSSLNFVLKNIILNSLLKRVLFLRVVIVSHGGRSNILNILKTAKVSKAKGGSRFRSKLPGSDSFWNCEFVIFDIFVILLESYEFIAVLVRWVFYIF